MYISLLSTYIHIHTYIIIYIHTYVPAYTYILNSGTPRKKRPPGTYWSTRPDGKYKNDSVISFFFFFPVFRVKKDLVDTKDSQVIKELRYVHIHPLTFEREVVCLEPMFVRKFMKIRSPILFSILIFINVSCLSIKMTIILFVTLKGPKGFKGESGIKGKTGIQGPQGAFGPTGEKGNQGEQVSNKNIELTLNVTESASNKRS